MLSTYETSCQMKKAEKSMKKSSVNPENLQGPYQRLSVAPCHASPYHAHLDTHLLTTTSDSLVTFSCRMWE